MTTAASIIRRHDALHSTWLRGARGVTVYLPPGFDEDAGHRYPVLFLHDGQNLFDPDRAHVQGQHWQVAESADELILAGRLEPLVIVGIDHAGEGRLADYTPTSAGRKNAGHASRYAGFLVEELMPFIARTYPVRNDFDCQGLGGSSLGGLVTLVIAHACPGTFGRLLVMSPSVWWDRGVILRELRRRPLDPAPRIWLDAGAREGARTIGDARRLRNVLQRSIDADRRETLHYAEDPEGDHAESSWAKRLPGALTYLFPATRPNERPPNAAGVLREADPE
jgi:predicted alpha/beta superfamily hydrolase